MTDKKNRNGLTVLWDWNGTLLDDVDICIKSMNFLLEKRNLPLLDRRRYRSVFTFPVKDYYLKAGFDFSVEPFEKPAEEFMLRYHKFLNDAPLHKGVAGTLRQLQNKGYRQIILSAMEQNSLVKTLEERNCISFFDAVYGIDDIYAHSKTGVAKKLFLAESLEPDGVILIGDTLHDLEVAGELGVSHLLVAHGHQSEQRLRQHTTRVVKNLSGVVSFLESRLAADYDG